MNKCWIYSRAMLFLILASFVRTVFAPNGHPEGEEAKVTEVEPGEVVPTKPAASPEFQQGKFFYQDPVSGMLVPVQIFPVGAGAQQIVPISPTRPSYNPYAMPMYPYFQPFPMMPQQSYMPKVQQVQPGADKPAADKPSVKAEPKEIRPILSSVELDKTLKILKKDLDQGAYSSSINRQEYENALLTLASLADRDLSKLTSVDLDKIVSIFKFAREQRPKDRTVLRGLSEDTDRRRSLLTLAISSFYSTDDNKKVWEVNGRKNNIVSVYSAAFEEYPAFSSRIKKYDIFAPAAELIRVIRKNLSDSKWQSVALKSLESMKERNFLSLIGDSRTGGVEGDLIVRALIAQLSIATRVFLPRSPEESDRLLTVLEDLSKNTMFETYLTGNLSLGNAFNKVVSDLMPRVILQQVKSIKDKIDEDRGYPKAAEMFVSKVMERFYDTMLGKNPRITVSDDVLVECFKLLQKFKEKLKWKSTHSSDVEYFWTLEWLFKKVIGFDIHTKSSDFVNERNKSFKEKKHSPTVVDVYDPSFFKRLMEVRPGYKDFIQQYAFIASLMPIRNKIDKASTDGEKMLAMILLDSFVKNEKFDYEGWPEECVEFTYDTIKSTAGMLGWTVGRIFHGAASEKEVFVKFKEFINSVLSGDQVFLSKIGKDGVEELRKMDKAARGQIDSIEREEAKRTQTK